MALFNSNPTRRDFTSWNSKVVPRVTVLPFLPVFFLSYCMTWCRVHLFSAFSLKSDRNLLLPPHEPQIVPEASRRNSKPYVFLYYTSLFRNLNRSISQKDSRLLCEMSLWDRAVHMHLGEGKWSAGKGEKCMRKKKVEVERRIKKKRVGKRCPGSCPGRWS